MKYIYMLVTKDQYELPLAVASSKRELGEMLGVSPLTIANSIARSRRDGHKSKYVRVDFPNNDID